MDALLIDLTQAGAVRAVATRAALRRGLAPRAAKEIGHYAVVQLAKGRSAAGALAEAALAIALRTTGKDSGGAA
jgi:hypothetical protein